MPVQSDPRTEEQRELDAALADAIVERQNFLLATNDEYANAIDLPHPANAKYDIEVTWGGVLGMALAINFYKPTGEQMATFTGGGGGIGWGAGKDWGSTTLNYKVEDIIGWECRFHMESFAFGVNTELWGLGGEYVGQVIGGGIGIGGMAVGGQGTMKPPIID